MKKKVIKLTEAQLVNMIKKTVKKVIKENEDEMMDKSSAFPHSKEDFIEYDYNRFDGQDTLTLFFKNDISEDFVLDFYLSYYSAGSSATWDDPADPEEAELSFYDITQTEPTEKEWTEEEFEAYLSHLGIWDDVLEKLTDIAIERRKDY